MFHHSSQGYLQFHRQVANFLSCLLLHSRLCLKRYLLMCMFHIFWYGHWQIHHKYICWKKNSLLVMAKVYCLHPSHSRSGAPLSHSLSTLTTLQATQSCLEPIQFKQSPSKSSYISSSTSVLEWRDRMETYTTSAKLKDIQLLNQ